MFERYTEKARRTIYFARHEASQFGSPYIESEHVLLGLLRESKALCAKLLANSPATADSIRKQIEKHTTFGEKIPTSVDLPITEECRRILVHASEEAERLGHKYVGTEHLLLGVLLEKQCYAAYLLNESGVSLEVARVHIGGGTLEEVATPSKSPGIPAGSSWQQLLYNPASETIIVEMRSVADRPLPPLGRLFVRPRHADAYEQIGNPADDVSYQTPVTCEKQPIVVFNSIKWDKVKGGGNPDGVYVYSRYGTLKSPGSLGWLGALFDAGFAQTAWHSHVAWLFSLTCFGTLTDVGFALFVWHSDIPVSSCSKPRGRDTFELSRQSGFVARANGPPGRRPKRAPCFTFPHYQKQAL